MQGYVTRNDLYEEFPFTVFRYDVKGTCDNFHWHKYMQIGLCLKGKGKFLSSDKVYDAQEGDIFIANNFEKHVAVTDPGLKSGYLFIIFLPEMIAYPGCREFDYEYLYLFRYDPKTFDNKIPGNLEVSKELRDNMFKIERLWREKKMNYEHEIDANLRLLLTSLINHYRQIYQEYFIIEKKRHNKLWNAVDYINKNYNENISLDDVSKKIYMSSSRFRHLFKETMNMSFKQYITYMRLSEAKRLLANTDMSVKEIAAQCSYSNLYQFYKVFNQYVGLSPAEYRKAKEN